MMRVLAQESVVLSPADTVLIGKYSSGSSVVLVDLLSDSAPFTITLPDLRSSLDKQFVFKNSGLNTVTIVTQHGQGINSQAVVSCAIAAGDCTTITTDSSEKWIILDGPGLSGVVTPEQFGAVGDGVHDDSAALNAAFVSNRRVVLNAGTYRISSTINIACDNLEVIGIPGKTKITSETLQKLVEMGDCSNVETYGATFESTDIDSAENPYGLISSDDKRLSNVVFRKCKLTAPYAHSNAVRLKCYVGSGLDNVRFIDCEIIDIGRMGIE